MAVHTAKTTGDTLHTEEYDEDYMEERAIEYHDLRSEEDVLLHHSYKNALSIDRGYKSSIDTHHHQTNRRRVDEPHEGFTYGELLNLHERSDTYSLFAKACGRGTCFYRPFTRAKRPSIDITASTSIDIRSQPSSTVREKAKLNNNYLTPVEFGIFRDPEGYARAIDAGGVDDRFKPKHRQHTPPSIEIGDQTSIDRRPEFGKGAYDRDGTWRFQWEEKDEYGVYKDDHGHARDVDGHIIRVSKDDIRSLLERASMDKHNYKCLPEHARSLTETKLVPEIYTKDEINEMFY
ncbi:hypothetical protein F2Q70_00004184 [Brassica cretica]|uniref:Uncharacterized protein n=1 Tax=Brassica cretica TaxID=69181 RepID=A0A8S9J3E0_BRACR|nr:hypothetical protein F2Q70_00004184 [Brassica cretica]